MPDIDIAPVVQPLPPGARRLTDIEARRFVRGRVLRSTWGSMLIDGEAMVISTVSGMTEQLELFRTDGSWWRAAHNGDDTGRYEIVDGELCTIQVESRDCRSFFRAPTGETYSRATVVNGSRLPESEQSARRVRSESPSWLKRTGEGPR